MATSAHNSLSIHRPRIGIYEPSPGPSGPSRYVHSLLANIDPTEFDMCVFCAATGPYAPSDGCRIERRGMPDGKPEASIRVGEQPGLQSVARSHARRSLWKKVIPDTVPLWAGFAREVRELAKFFRRQPVDLLHSQSTGNEEAPIAARLAGISRVVGTFHVDPMYDLEGHRSGSRYRVLEVLSNHANHRLISISDEVKRLWMRRTMFPASRIVTIHNGIDASTFCRQLDRRTARERLQLPADDRLLIGGVGRLDPAKGFRYLIEALSLLESGPANVGVVLAGRGPELDELKRQAERLGVGNRVFFLGFCSNVQVVYDAVDIVAAPSLCESLSYVVMESMAHELPVVGSRVGGIPEVIAENETGFLVEPRSATGLASAIARLVQSPELRQQMGQAGRARVERHFSEREMVRKTLDVYRDMLLTGRNTASSQTSHGEYIPTSTASASSDVEITGMRDK